MLIAGARLGPYELLSPIGVGGMGEVWKARDTRLNRIVALKFSLAAFTDRFVQEARSIGALNHPNIATLYDVGENYLVMEFIDGIPIKPPGDMRKLLDIASNCRRAHCGACRWHRPSRSEARQHIGR